MSRKPIRHKRRSSNTPLGPPPDRRALEKTMVDMQRMMRKQEFDDIEGAESAYQSVIAQHGGRIPSQPPETELERAQDLAYEAFGATGDRRAELARKALEVSADCADAYVILAEETATSLDESLELYRKGVEAGERALGADFFEENVGHFWGIIETRPYMRARLGLAENLWLAGAREESIRHFWEMLRLDPDDHQGVRIVLAGILMTVGDDTGLDRLFKQYSYEDSAEWLYTRALWLYRKYWRGPLANEALWEAFDENRYIPMFLISPDSLLDMLLRNAKKRGLDKDVQFVKAHVGLWRETKGAIDWLREEMANSMMEETIDFFEDIGPSDSQWN